MHIRPRWQKTIPKSSKSSPLSVDIPTRFIQWECQDPKMEVGWHHISGHILRGYDASTCQKYRRHAKRVVPVDMPKKLFPSTCQNLVVSVDMPKVCSRRHAKKTVPVDMPKVYSCRHAKTWLFPSTSQKFVPVDMPKKDSVDMPQGCSRRHAKKDCLRRHAKRCSGRRA